MTWLQDAAKFEEGTGLKINARIQLEKRLEISVKKGLTSNQIVGLKQMMGA